MLARLAVRPDRALAVAALGTAAAILLPVAATLVLGTLAGAPARDQWIAYAPPGEALAWEDAEPRPLRVAALAADGRMAYVAGDPGVARGARLAMPLAVSNATRSATVLPLLHSDAVLVHPLDLGPATPVAALFAKRPSLEGATVAPARGADAFEDATGQDLAAQGLVLTALSLPAVCLVSVAFARQEVRAQARRTATLVALGGARVAAVVAATRMAVMAASGAALATVGGFVLYQWGPAQFHPEDAPRLRLALAIALPALAAAVGGVATVLFSRTRMDILRGAAQDVEADAPLPLPLAARPLLLGVRLLPVLLLAAALFAVDVGFPAAAARIPAALAGGPGEWVLGAERGLRAGEGVDARVADVAGFDGNVSAIVAETVVATLLQGEPAVLRGAPWAALATYHGLALVEGSPPGPGEVALGGRLADRLEARVGDSLTVQNAARPEARVLRVAALVQAPGPLGDEAFVDGATGRDLGDLPAGKATLVRFRPQTEAAADAVLRRSALLQVTSVALEPSQPAAGSIAKVAISFANLGVERGTRALAVRVDGVAVATLTVTLSGHSTGNASAAFLVPAGPFHLQVNPGLDGAGSPPPREWDVDGPATQGGRVRATLREGGAPVANATAALYASLEDAAADRDRLATGRTDAAGRVELPAPRSGELVLGSVGGPRAFATVPVVAAGQGVRVEAVWTEPSTVPLGEPARLLARVRNLGTQAADATVPAFIDQLQFATQEVRLAPGATSVVSYPLFLLHPAATLRVGDTELQLGGGSIEAGPASPASLEDRELQSGAGVQAQVANRALGNARTALVGLGGSAAASTLAIVYLATQRTLAGRRHAAGLLLALGQQPPAIRSRAALEGAFLGGTAMALAIVPAKLLFLAAGQGPPVFAHALPDPITPLFAVQATAAFAAACALAAYWGSETLFRGQRPL